MRQPVLALLAAIFAVVGLGALATYVANLPTTYRVAVGPMVNEDVQLMVAALQVFARERESFRIRLVLTSGTPESAAKLDAGDADLAVVRADVAFPRQGATVAILRRDFVTLMVPGGSSVKSLGDLAGRTIGIVRDNPGNVPLLHAMLTHAGIDPEDVNARPMRLPDLKAALADGSIDAVMAVGPPTERVQTGALKAVTEAGKGQPRFIPVEDTEAIAQRFPVMEPVLLVRGIYGGTPPRPAEEIETVAVAHRLVANKALSQNQIAEFTRTLMAAKPLIAAEVPAAARIEAPEADRSATLPVHAGTLAYLDGQMQTFLERYGDLFYLGIMGLGLSGSLVAGYFSLAGSRARREAARLLGTLQAYVAEARAATDDDGLDRIEERVDGIFSETIGNASHDKLDATLLIAFFLAFEQVRRAIAEQRRYLAELA